MTQEEPANNIVADYLKEYTRWLRILDKYHTFRFTENYEQYTAYNTTIGSPTDISDPIAPEMVERIIQKLFERAPNINVSAKGKQVPSQITNVIASIPLYYWDCPERIQHSGTMRSKLKVWAREFCVLGNLAVETYYDNKADVPDTRIIPIEDIIFDPTKSLKTSKRYYIKQYITKEELEDLKEREDKKGNKLGRFNPKVVDQILGWHEEQTLLEDPTSARINRSGDDVYQKPVGDIELTTIWEGKHCTRILDWYDIVEEYDNEYLDDNPLDFAMDIEVPKQPYAFSFLDFIKGISHAKDLLLNQIIDYGSKLLNPPLFVDPNLSAVYKKTLSQAWQNGGIVFANPQQVDHKPIPPIPQQSFELMDYIQKRAESVSGVGGYLGGQSHSQLDKTKGTKGGIQALIEQAADVVNDRQQNLEESIIEPMINKWLKYAADLMGKDEIKYVLISGESPKWVKVTKGLLSGKIKLHDLVEAEIVDDQKKDPITGKTEAEQMVDLLVADGKDPEKDLMFDVTWVVKVETGSMELQDQLAEQRSFDSWVGLCAQLQVPLDPKKIATEAAHRRNIKEPETYYQEQPETQPGMPQGMPMQPQMQSQQVPQQNKLLNMMGAR